MQQQEEEREEGYIKAQTGDKTERWNSDVEQRKEMNGEQNVDWKPMFYFYFSNWSAMWILKVYSSWFKSSV